MRHCKRKVVWVATLFLFCILSLPGITAARMEFSLGDDRRLLVEGTLWSQSLLRSDDFKFSRQFDPVSLRNNSQIELTVDNLISNWGFIDRVDVHANIRGVYEAIYDIRNNEFGDEGPAFRLLYGHGNTGPGFPGFQYLPDGTPLHPPGVWRAHAPQRPSGKHPIFNFFPGAPYAHGRVKLRGSEVGLTNFENTENQIKFEHTDSNDENELREFYFDITAGRHWLRLGKQIISWGKTDYFRSQDIINPLDLSWHAFYEPWEDILIPQWLAQYQYQLGTIGPFDNIALELVMNFDDFQPIALGQHGSPWAHPFSNEVAWFALFGSAAGGWYPDPNNPSETRWFGLGTDRIAHPSWSLRNMEYGGRLSWRYKGWYFALTNWYGFDDLGDFYSPFQHTPQNPMPIVYWPALQGLVDSGMSFAEADQTARFLAGWGGQWEARFYRNNTTGLSVDYFWDWASTVVRLESSYTNKVKVQANPNEYWTYLPPQDLRGMYPTGFDTADSKRRKIQWALGLDRPTWVHWLNPTKTFFLSSQIVATHILGWEGGAHWGDASPRTELILTGSATGWYYRDRIIPQVWAAYLPTPSVNAWTGGANVEWLITDHWSVKGGVIVISGGYNRHNYGNAFWQAQGGPAEGSRQFGQILPSPLGRGGINRAGFGIIKENFGVYQDRDEFFFKFQYRF